MISAVLFDFSSGYNEMFGEALQLEGCAHFTTILIIMLSNKRKLFLGMIVRYKKIKKSVQSVY